MQLTNHRPGLKNTESVRIESREMCTLAFPFLKLLYIGKVKVTIIQSEPKSTAWKYNKIIHPKTWLVNFFSNFSIFRSQDFRVLFNDYWDEQCPSQRKKVTKQLLKIYKKWNLEFNRFTKIHDESLMITIDESNFARIRLIWTCKWWNALSRTTSRGEKQKISKWNKIFRTEVTSSGHKCIQLYTDDILD